MTEEKHKIPKARIQAPVGPAYWVTAGLIVTIVILYWSWRGMEYNLMNLLDLGNLSRMAYELTHPDLSEPIVARVFEEMIETVQTAILGTFLAVIITFPLAFFAAFNVAGKSFFGKSVYFTFRTLFSLLRAIPAIIIAIYMVSAVGIGPFAGALALALHSIGQLGKLFAEAIEQVEKGPVEAITALGGNKQKVVWYAILPQVYPSLIAYSLFILDINVRMSMVIGLVGAGGIGSFVQEYLGLVEYQKVSTALIALLIVVMAFDLFSGWVRKRII